MTGGQRTTRTQRVLRGWLLALSSATLATAAHGVAGGGAPDSAVAVVVIVLIAWASAALARRRRGLPSVLAVLGASQLAMHVLLAGGHPDHAAGAYDGWQMLFAHVVATGLTAVLLIRADAAVQLAETGLDLLRGVLRGVHFVGVPTPLAVSSVPVVVRHDHVRDVQARRVCARRGPPRFS